MTTSAAARTHRSQGIGIEVGPARPGRLIGRGKVVQRGRDVCYLSGELSGPDGKPVAVVTATALIRSVPRQTP